MLVKQDGSMWSTSNPKFPRRSKPFLKVIPSGAKSAASSHHVNLVLMQDGSVWATGKDVKGQLSFVDASAATRRMFSFLETVAGANEITAGGYHSMVLTQNGQVLATGWNKHGQLAEPGTAYRSRFLLIMSRTGSRAVALAAGDSHSMVLKQDGSVWATGRNYNGQLGDGWKTDRYNFFNAIPDSVVDISAGGYHSMVLKEDGSVWATGWNEHGQLGDGTAIDRTSYVQVMSSGAKSVAAGRRHSLMLKQDGSVWATGYNEYGQLGNEWTIDSKVFVQVIPEGVKIIAAGAFHSMVLKDDGSVWATGSNEYGQFGDGTTTSEKNFVRLAPLDNGSRRN